METLEISSWASKPWNAVDNCTENHLQVHKFLELKYGFGETRKPHLIWCQTPEAMESCPKINYSGSIKEFTSPGRQLISSGNNSSWKAMKVLSRVISTTEKGSLTETQDWPDLQWEPGRLSLGSTRSNSYKPCCFPCLNASVMWVFPMPLGLVHVTPHVSNSCKYMHPH